MKRGARLISLSLPATLAFGLAAFVCGRTASADELTLRDGTKISGTIVGFEEDSFKVKTSYGFAVVQKSQVLTIAVADATRSEADKKPDSAAKALPVEKPTTEFTSVSAPVPVTAPAVPSLPRPGPAPPIKPVAPLTAKSAEAPPVVAPAATLPVTVTTLPKRPAPALTRAPQTVVTAPPAAPLAPVAVAPPAKPPAPEPIHEAVVGNTYTNETYRFRMYKPPDWDVIAAAPAVMPGAITAMGTADDTTYLLVGQAPSGKSLATDMDTAQRRLRDVMQNFHPIDEKQIMVSGATATEQHFNGSVDEHDWSGVVVLVQRGTRLYTIFGMTRADNDLVQIQENVIARTISSLQFTD